VLQAIDNMAMSSVLPAGRARRAGSLLPLAFLAAAGGMLAARAIPARASVAPRSVATDEVLVHYRGSPGTQRVGVPGGGSVAGVLSRLRSDPAVGYARPDYLVRAAAGGFWPDDPGTGGRGHWYRDQWNFLSPTRVTGGIGMPGGWQQLVADGRPGAKGVTVAVLDTGVAYRNKGHRFRRDPDLPRVKRFVHPKDLVDGDGLPLDRQGHGTHVASTIAQSTDNGLGLTGISYGVRVMPIRVLNEHEIGKGSDVARGIRFATAHGADVINLSLDFKPDVKHCEQIVSVCHAIQHAIHKGAIVVAAAGNDDIPRVSYPAAADGVIAVGASTYRGCAADYSNYGRGVNLVAPGGGQDKAPQATGDASCTPSADGYEIRQYSLLPGPAKHGDFRKFGITGLEGTSMSAAHVSGVAAAVIASRVCGKHPSPRRVARRLESTALDRGAAGRDDLYGNGLLDASRALSPRTPCRG
jgi:serine protease